ncbi:MAG: HAMP domain-containing sensor histidine kinase [Bdellovibrionota bacterium]
MTSWETRALQEVMAANHQESLALQNSLPEFLSQIVDALSTTINRTDARVRWDKSESTRIGKKHGLERASSYNYTMDQLIFEYHILRQVVCEEMEKEAALSPIEREVIVCAIEQAVNDAATEYSEVLRDIQESFTNTLAHDLRGPITSTRLTAQLIIRKAGDVDQCLTMGARISSMMDRLDSMIHNLLDVGKLRAGQKIVIKRSVSDLSEIMGIAVEEQNFIHGHRIHFHSSGDGLGNWDADGFRRVFDNLLSNSVKYSPAESEIFVNLSKIDNRLMISVKNSGLPISEDDQSILFQQYRRTRDSEKKPGWGLGLAVVKGITEAHMGTVGIESSEAGTIFTLNLPVIN